MIENYWPISILSSFSKVLESLIYDTVYSAFVAIVSEKQHGSIHGRSTVTNLLTFTDFSKAFDKLDHRILMDKVSRLNIFGNYLRLLEFYLINTVSVVEYASFQSHEFFFTLDVPQGSN